MNYKHLDLMEVAEEVLRQSEVKRDFMVMNSALEMYPNLAIGFDGGQMTLETNDTFRQQIASRFGIPQSYAETMISGNPDLFATNINSWLELNRDERRLVRTLDGTARCFASDKYRPLDNYDVVNTAMDEICNNHTDLRFADCDVTPDRLYLKVLNPRVRAEVVPGDIVESGMIISNSEVAKGSLSVVPYVNRLVCTNGMVINEMGKRQRHLGSRYGEDFSVYTERTVDLDTSAVMAKLRDIIRSLVNDSSFSRVVDAFRLSAGIELPRDVPIVGFVEIANKAYGVREDESDNVLERFIQTANTNRSMWDYANAVTAEAHTSESYERAVQLQTIGWSIASNPEKAQQLIAASYHATPSKRKRGKHVEQISA